VFGGPTPRARHEIGLLAILSFLKLLAQTHPRRWVGSGLALSLDIAPALRGAIENVVCRLDEAGPFKLAQEVARGDETDAFIDYRLASSDIGIFE
jgi:hypothetical protein